MFKAKHAPKIKGCTLLAENGSFSNYGFFINAAEHIFANVPYDELWIMDDFHYMCDLAIEQLATGKDFSTTELYKTVVAVLACADETVLWYGDDFKELPAVTTKNELLVVAEAALKDQPFEVYACYSKRLQ